MEFRGYGVLLHSHNFQVHSDSEWSNLLESQTELVNFLQGIVRDLKLYSCEQIVSIR